MGLISASWLYTVTILIQPKFSWSGPLSLSMCLNFPSACQGYDEASNNCFPIDTGAKFVIPWQKQTANSIEYMEMPIFGGLHTVKGKLISNNHCLLGMSERGESQTPARSLLKKSHSPFRLASLGLSSSSIMFCCGYGW